MNVAARIFKTQWLMRAPIALYRMRLGWLLGRRFLLLEHRGRTSGEARHVVLEVVSRPDAGRPSPRHEVAVVPQSPGRPALPGEHGTPATDPGVAEALSADEAEPVLAQYQRRHPRTWKKLLDVLRDATGEDDPRFPLVRLRLVPPE